MHTRPQVGLCFAFLFLSASLWAEEPLVPASQYIGSGGGLVTGFGLSYRYWDGPWGVQLNVMPLNADIASLWSVGLNGLLALDESRNSRFFGYAGASVARFQLGSYFDIQYAVAGGGFGIEFVLFDHLALDIQSGIATIYDVNLNRFIALIPTGEAGLYYRL